MLTVLIPSPDLVVEHAGEDTEHDGHRKEAEDDNNPNADHH